MGNAVKGAGRNGGHAGLGGQPATNGHVAARTGRNPQTGAIVDVPAANVPRFKPGKALRDMS